MEKMKFMTYSLKERKKNNVLDIPSFDVFPHFKKFFFTLQKKKKKKKKKEKKRKKKRRNEYFKFNLQSKSNNIS